MNIQPIPHEPGRFWCSSRTRPGMDHLVDLYYRGESGKEKPKRICSCEAMQARGNPICPHIESVVSWVINELEKKGA